MAKLTHTDRGGAARMVEVSQKAATERIAVAEGIVRMSAATLELVLSGQAKKGDVLGAARIAGIMAAKKTHELIPLCHPLAIAKVDIDIAPLGSLNGGPNRPSPAKRGRGTLTRPDRNAPGLAVRAAVKMTGQTGVEMEALTAVAVAW